MNCPKLFNFMVSSSMMDIERQIEDALQTDRANPTEGLSPWYVVGALGRNEDGDWMVMLQRFPLREGAPGVGATKNQPFLEADVYQKERCAEAFPRGACPECGGRLIKTGFVEGYEISCRGCKRIIKVGCD